MSVKYFLLFFYWVIIGEYSSAKPVAPVNPGFNNRYAYVSSFLEHITDYEEDRLLSTIIVFTEDRTTEFAVIGIKDLYYVLYGGPTLSKEQLYFSAGKIFLRDTLFLSREKEMLFRNYIVDKPILEALNTLGFEKVRLRYCKDHGVFAPGTTHKERLALKFFFDRRFYPCDEVHDVGDVVDFEYSFQEFNMIPVYRAKQRYIQIWDKNGTLVRDELE